MSGCKSCTCRAPGRPGAVGLGRCPPRPNRIRIPVIAGLRPAVHIYAAMSSLSALRSLARQCLAAAAMFGFSLNVATPTIAHGCAHPAMAGGQAGVGTAHHPHDSAPVPADESPHGKKCQCVGHSCGTGLAVLVPASSGPGALPAVLQVPSVHRDDRLPAVAQHLLPFAVGPPRSLSA